MHACSGPDIDYEVCGPNSILIMLHHDHGVAKITQEGECGEQAIVVSLMQPDGGLVKHIHHTLQARTNLAG